MGGLLSDHRNVHDFPRGGPSAPARTRASCIHACALTLACIKWPPAGGARARLFNANTRVTREKCAAVAGIISPPILGSRLLLNDPRKAGEGAGGGQSKGAQNQNFPRRVSTGSFKTPLIIGNMFSPAGGCAYSARALPGETTS